MANGYSFLANFVIYFFVLTMPVIKSSKKDMRKSRKRAERNKAVKSQMKTFVKKILDLSKTKKEEAVKLLPKAYSVIDTAKKKNLIHKNNAARKKSLLARSVAAGSTKTESKK